MVQERATGGVNMSEIGGGIGLPTMSQREMFEQLLGEDESRSASEPEIAAAIGEQMIHMDLRPLPRSIRKRRRYSPRPCIFSYFPLKILEMISSYLNQNPMIFRAKKSCTKV